MGGEVGWVERVGKKKKDGLGRAPAEIRSGKPVLALLPLSYSLWNSCNARLPVSRRWGDCAAHRSRKNAGWDVLWSSHKRASQLWRVLWPGLGRGQPWLVNTSP